MTFYRLLPMKQVTASIDGYKKVIGLFAGALLFSAVVFTVFLYIMIYKPIAHARHIFSSMEAGHLNLRLGKAWYMEFQDIITSLTACQHIFSN